MRKRFSASQLWLLLSLIPLATWLCYTALVMHGSLATLAVHQEQWLLQRPLTRFDCVVYQWKYLGEAPLSLALLLVVCAVCWRLKYRLRAVFVLLACSAPVLALSTWGNNIYTSRCRPDL